MVAEGAVLRRIEHFQQRGCRIPADVAGELVDLVEHEDRIRTARLLEVLNDPPRHRADVGAAVAADLRFVADAAERDPDEVAVHRPCNRLAERGLAHAGRSDQTEDRRPAFPPAVELEHREEFQNAFLDVLEAIVVGIQHPRRLVAVEPVVGAGEPRHVEQPVDVGVADMVLRRSLGNQFQAGELLFHHFGDPFRQGEFAEAAFDFNDVRVAGVFAQLLLDGAQLFAEEELPLRLTHRLMDFVLDLHAEFEHLQLPVHEDRQRLEAGAYVGVEEQQQLFGVTEIQRIGQQVGKPPRSSGVEDSDLQLFRQARQHAGQLLEEHGEALLSGLVFHLVAPGQLRQCPAAGHRRFVFVAAEHRTDDPADAAHHDPDASIRKVQFLDHPHQHADGGPAFLLIAEEAEFHLKRQLFKLFVGGEFREEGQQPVAFHCPMERCDIVSFDQQRGEAEGIDHRFPRCQQRYGNQFRIHLRSAGFAGRYHIGINHDSRFRSA